ncbi:hypothetical protein GOBAR_AA05404 [Gossypium barbadense]|uniref:Bifunctional inhibitor/plant lipid transfer protein/seed storage helical domain-containing protein n=1 Tax=Gossypium barbadense TaxID=3634 RepID=A0A2P5YHU7_GOSBA|nr:hypothetical protein GOBAR_AA05404 [Gossypium barbadense]
MKGIAMVAMLFINRNKFMESMAQSVGPQMSHQHIVPCLDYIPGKALRNLFFVGCCSAWLMLVRSNLQCSASVNQTQQCCFPNKLAMLKSPSSSPSGSPSGTSNSPSSGGGGSKSNVPTTDDSTSAGNTTKQSFSVVCLFFLLFIALA